MKPKTIAVVLSTLLVIVCTIALASTTVSATKTYEQGEAIVVSEPCYNDGYYCSDTAECNITFLKPNDNIILANQQMTNQNSYHNYTLNETFANNTGSGFSYCITCVDSGKNASKCFDYDITASGTPLSQTRTDAVSRSIYFIFGLALVLIIGSFFVKSTPIKLTLLIFGFMIILVSINLVFVGLQDEVVNPRLEGFFDFFTSASWYLYWFAGGLLGIIWFITVIQTATTRKKEKNLRRFGL